jgi:membrane associated rhomboid family serine protease
MAYADRDYYREDDDRDWSFLPGRVTLWLVGLLLAIFVLQVLSRNGPGRADSLLANGWLKWPLVQAGDFWRPATAAFVHDSSQILPIACCLITLFLCGRWLEEELGSREMLAYLFVSLVITQLAELMARAGGLLDPDVPSFGSLGIVTAVIVQLGIRHPRATVNVLVFPVPMGIVAAVWVGLGLVDKAGFGGREAFVRVLAAAAFAALYHYAPLSLTDRSRPRARPRLRLVPVDDRGQSEADGDAYAGEDRKAVSRPAPSLDEHLDAKVDFVLEKMAKSGRESLTADELAVLQRASKIYRNRRGE